jgi:hypothetical protein
MQKRPKIVWIAVIGFFFSIATLEIDAFGYDNTFFDAYDSYVHVDNQPLYHASKIDQGCFTCPGIIQSSVSPASILISCYEGYFLSPWHQKRKLYLTQSSLLI